MKKFTFSRSDYEKSHLTNTVALVQGQGTGTFKLLLVAFGDVNQGLVGPCVVSNKKVWLRASPGSGKGQGRCPGP